MARVFPPLFSPYDFPVGCCGRARLRGVAQPFRFVVRRTCVVLDGCIRSPKSVFAEIVEEVVDIGEGNRDE